MENRFETKVLICVDCHEEFVFTASAQQYFADKGYHKPPKRCKSCHSEHRRMKSEMGETEQAYQQSA
jgi:hypothetical protein